MSTTCRLMVAAAIVMWWGFSFAEAAAIPRGSSEQTLKVGGLHLTIFTYRPDNCEQPSLLLVFHGLHRNADGSRNYVRRLADHECMLVVAPLFDRGRFPGWRYQYGGIVRRGVVQGPETWTGHVVPDLVRVVRELEGRPTMKYAMIGHSAGGQFLSRLGAFVQTEAQRIVIANAGTHVFASLHARAPFGLGGVYADGAAETELRRYLAQPITIFLGRDDTDPDDDLNDSEEAMAQGETRYERGLNAFRTAQSLAKSRSWTFSWRLVVLAGVGHNASQMLSSDEALEALRP